MSVTLNDGGEPSGFATFSPAMEHATHYIAWVLSRFRPFLRGDILEVGLGHGSYQPYLSAYGTYLGVDIDHDAVRRAQARFPQAAFAQADVTAAPLSAQIDERQFDAILCFNVLEHIEDHAAAVRALLGVLRPGGHLLIGVPAGPALFNDLDRLAGHYRRYRRRDLLALVPSDVASLHRLEYFNPIGALGWWANTLISHRALDTPAVSHQVEFFDRYVLPLSRLLNPLTRRFFGQSLLCVAERR